jgi:hypothetical protein
MEEPLIQKAYEESVITVKKLQEEIERSFYLRKCYDEAKTLSDKAYARYQEVSMKAAAMLEGQGLDKFHAPSGTFSYKYEESYRVPKTPENREKFFAYLRAKGIYEEMISVNSQTLNSFAKTEEKNALDDGNFDFKIPGIEKGTPILKPVMRKA